MMEQILAELSQLIIPASFVFTQQMEMAIPPVSTLQQAKRTSTSVYLGSTSLLTGRPASTDTIRLSTLCQEHQSQHRSPLAWPRRSCLLSGSRISTSL